MKSLSRSLWHLAVGACLLFAIAGPFPNLIAAERSAPPAPAPDGGASWRLWGGPGADFRVASGPLAESWPTNGPARLWSRPLGDGYSGIAAEDGVLYTAYRRETNDVVVALDAATGRTLWETAYPAPFSSGWPEEVGPGPYAMPEVVGDRLVMAGSNGQLLSLDKRTGKIIWHHDLWDETFTGTRLSFGYSCHVLPYKRTLIALVGTRRIKESTNAPPAGGSVVALRADDGGVVWKGLTFTNAHSSPKLITVDGQPQVVALVAQEVVAFSPEDGTFYWSHPHPNEYGLAISQPIWGPDNILVISTAYGGGARGLRLRQAAGRTTVEELWRSSRIQCHFGSMILDGHHAYVSSGQSGPGFLIAFDVRSGTVRWQERGFGKAQLVAADGKLVLLDEEGVLGLVRAKPERLEILARAPVLKKVAWTPPTLVGTRLYVRDRETIMALELGNRPAADRALMRASLPGQP
ncbi:MAG TPA: PQQ-binding-like beta-propeller repeat protein [Methylomirabilota bacterium]|nr:PQQ-binding-like beta-propeller repeat protein [Methylomirabilota bacterium]